MARVNIIEVTEDQAIVRYTDRFFRRVQASTPDIPASYDGKYVSAVLVATSLELTDAQMDNLETQIEAITGVDKAFALIGPARIPIDRVPVDTAEKTYALKINIEAGFNIIETPIETP